jgi:hypothetical protein
MLRNSSVAGRRGVLNKKEKDFEFELRSDTELEKISPHSEQEGRKQILFLSAC